LAVSTRTLALVVVGLVVALAVTVVLALLTVRTPPMSPLPLPSVSAA
jgi:hypothetical protein